MRMIRLVTRSYRKESNDGSSRDLWRFLLSVSAASPVRLGEGLQHTFLCGAGHLSDLAYFATGPNPTGGLLYLVFCS